MGRMWELKPDHYAWNLERCEELLLIASYEEIKPFIVNIENWVADFENHFYQHGNGVAFYFVDHINAARRRKTLPKLAFSETDVFEYGRSPDKMMKSEHRQRVRDELAAATTDERIRRVARAVEETALLRPPHIPFAEYKDRQSRFEEDSTKSREDTRKRISGAAAATLPAARPLPCLQPDKAATMLSYASPKLWPDVIKRLTGDDALVLVPQIENAELRDALILHALNA